MELVGVGVPLHSSPMTENLLRILFLGQELPDEEVRKIPNPRAEVHLHVLTKCAQLGSVAGMGLLGPLLGIFKSRSLAAVRQYSVRTGKILTAVLLPLAPVLTEARLTGEEGEEEKVYDRAYRLRKNEGQMRCDRWAFAGGALGVVGGGLAGGTVLQGMLTGFAVGTVAAGFYTNVYLPKQQKGDED